MNPGKVLKKLADKRGSDKAFLFRERCLSFKSLSKIVDSYCYFFQEIGIEKGTKVGIYLPNLPEYVFTYLALFKMGAVAVPLDHRLKLEEVFILLNHAGCDYFITYPGKNLQPEEIKSRVSTIKEVIFTYHETDEFLSLEKTLNSLGKEFPATEISENDLAVILYTSGTTGIPKGVMWTYRHLDSPCATMKYYNYLLPKDVGMCAVPLSHNGGICTPLLILNEIPMLLLERLSPMNLLQGIVQRRITFTFVVPTQFSGLVNLKEFETANLSSLRWIALFGAPGGYELVDRFKKYCPQALLLAGYGLTESAAPNVLMPIEKIKYGSVGKPVPWMEVKIVDNEGKPVPTGEIGEIIMKGWPVTPGYYRQPELTAEVIKDGWLYTGDYGKFDEEGYLYIVGRKKDVIIVGGLNVFATEVEGILRQHPKIKEVAVVGVPNPLRGEAIKAVIVPVDGKSISKYEVINFCRQHLAPYKIPSIIEIRTNLPRTGTGKVKKELLK